MGLRLTRATVSDRKIEMAFFIPLSRLSKNIAILENAIHPYNASTAFYTNSCNSKTKVRKFIFKLVLNSKHLLQNNTLMHTSIN